MKIEEIGVAELTPYENNSRTHDEEQVSQIVASIKEFGFTNPILIDEHNGVIAGHGRLMAAQKIGMEKIPCIVLEGLTDVQKRAYIIADNKIVLNAGWDADLLRYELDLLDEDDFDVSQFGLDFDDLFQPIEIEDEPEEPDQDADPKPPSTEVTIKIVCEDDLIATQIKDELSVIISEKGIIGARVASK